MRPKNAIFRTVNGIEEAFRPGTERRREEERAPTREIPTGPQMYDDLIRREREAQAAQEAAPPPQSAPPPPKKQDPPEDLSGLF